MRLLLNAAFCLGSSCCAIWGQTSPYLDAVSLGSFGETPDNPIATGGGASHSFGTWFSGYSREYGNELWKIENDEANMPRDIRPGPESSNPSQFQAIGSRIIFVADDGIHGPEIRSELEFEPAVGSPLADFQTGDDHAAPVLLGNSQLAYGPTGGDRPIWFTTDGYESNQQVTWVWACVDLNTVPVKAGTYARGSVTQVKQSSNNLFYAARLVGDSRHALFWGEGVLPAIEIGALSETSTIEAPLAPDMHVEAYSVVVHAIRRMDGKFGIRVYDLRLRSGMSLGVQPDGQIPWLASNGIDLACCVTGSGVQVVKRAASDGPISSTPVVSTGAGTPSSHPSNVLIGFRAQTVFFQADNPSQGRSLYAVKMYNGGTAVEIDSSLHGAGHLTPYGLHSIVYTKSNLGLFDLLVWNDIDPLRVHSGAFSSVSSIRQALDPAPDTFSPKIVIQGKSSEWPVVQLFGLSSGGSIYTAAHIGHSDTSVAGYFAGGYPFDILYAFADNIPSGDHVPVGPDFLVRSRLRSNGGGWSDIRLYPRSGITSQSADFTELGGKLYFTANNNGRRVVCYCSGISQASAVALEGVWNVEQLVELNGRLFVLGTAVPNASGSKSLFQISTPLSGPVVSRFGGSNGESVVRLMPAGNRLYYLLKQTGPQDQLWKVNSGAVAPVLVCHIDKGIDNAGSLDSYLAEGENLFFRAPDAGGGKRLFKTDGLTTTTAPNLGSTDLPHLSGIWNHACVVWAETGTGAVQMWTWDGINPPLLRHQGPVEKVPDEVGLAGHSSGIEWQNGFVYNTGEGRLMYLRDDAATVLTRGFAGCDTLSLDVLSGRLVFWQRSPTQELRLWSLDGPFLEAAPLLREGMYSSGGWVSAPIRKGGQLWYLTYLGGSDETSAMLVKTDGTAIGTTKVYSNWWHLGLGQPGTLGSHLIMPGRQYFGGESGPYFLNSPPRPFPASPLTVFKRNQTNVFTYEQILPTLITDEEGDPTGPLFFFPGYLSVVKRNGVPLSGLVGIAPGDVFEWLPRPQDVQDSYWRPGRVEVSDPWHSGACQVGVLESGHDEWARQQFTPVELGDINVAGMHADPDKDGISNGLEFVFGRDPKLTEQEAGWEFELPSNGSGSSTTRPAVFRFTRAPVLAPGVTLRVLISINLIDWSSVATRYAGSTSWTTTLSSVQESTRQDGRIQVEVQHQMLQAGGFMRIEATFQ